MLTRPDFFIAKRLSINEIFHTIKLPHKKEKGVSLMLNNYYIEKMLEMKDIILTDVNSIANKTHIYFKLPRKIHSCPICQQQTNHVHDYRLQKFKDIPMLGPHTFSHYRKRRYVCPHCNKRF